MFSKILKFFPAAVLSQIILPAQFIFPGVKLNLSNDKVSFLSNLKNMYSFRVVEIKTKDGVNLEALEINNKEQKSPLKYIMYFNGNAMHLENSIDEYCNNSTGANALLFNYRGVGGSAGLATSAQDLINDGIAQVEYLRNKGVSLENIILKGHSLGGAIATKVAEHYHNLNKINKEGQPYLFAGRTFSKLSTVASELICKTLDKEVSPSVRKYFIPIVAVSLIPFAAVSLIPFIPSSLPFIAASLIPAVFTSITAFAPSVLTSFAKMAVPKILFLTDWEIDTASAYKEIDENHKNHVNIKISKIDETKLGETRSGVQEDGIISHEASLYKAVKAKKIYDETEEARLQRKDKNNSYKLHPNHHSMNYTRNIGHNISLNCFTSRNNGEKINAEEKFNMSVRNSSAIFSR